MNITHGPLPAAATSRDELAADLRLVVGRLGRRMRQHAVGGLSASQVSALATLERHGPIPMGRLSQLEGVAPPTMTRIVDWLQQHELAERRPDPADARCSVVRITPTGHTRLGAVRHDRTAFLAAQLSELSDEEIGDLVAALPALERLAGDAE